MKPAPAAMAWDEGAGNPASFSCPPRTPLTLLTERNTSSGLRVLGSNRRCPTAIGLFPTEQMGSKEAPLPCLAVRHCFPAFWTTDAVCGQRGPRPQVPASRPLGKRPCGRQGYARRPSMTWRSSGRLCRRRVKDTGLQRKHIER